MPISKKTGVCISCKRKTRVNNVGFCLSCWRKLSTTERNLTQGGSVDYCWSCKRKSRMLVSGLCPTCFISRKKGLRRASIIKMRKALKRKAMTYLSSITKRW